MSRLGPLSAQTCKWHHQLHMLTASFACKAGLVASPLRGSLSKRASRCLPCHRDGWGHPMNTMTHVAHNPNPANAFADCMPNAQGVVTFFTMLVRQTRHPIALQGLHNATPNYPHRKRDDGMMCRQGASPPASRRRGWRCPHAGQRQVLKVNWNQDVQTPAGCH